MEGFGAGVRVFVWYGGMGMGVWMLEVVAV